MRNQSPSSRRNFLGTLATSAAAISAASFAPLAAGAQMAQMAAGGPDDIFKNLKGKHRVVFDANKPNEVFPFAWPTVFMMTNEATGTPAKDQNVVVVLRHLAIPYALDNKVWAKYNLAEIFKAGELGPAYSAKDAKTAVAMRNPFWMPQHGDFQVPGMGAVDIGINHLQEKGAIICACNAALTVYSAAVAQQMGKNAEEVKRDWMEGVLPGVKVVPSGVWALGRAQEAGCAYIYAG